MERLPFDSRKQDELIVIRQTSMWLAVWFVAQAMAGAAYGWQEEGFEQHATAVRAALAQRELATALEKLKLVKEAAQTDEQKATADRLELLKSYVIVFWGAVDRGGLSLRGTDELTISGKIVSVVEYDKDTGRLVLRVDGQNRRYTLEDMPVSVALVLAQRVMPPDVPENQVYFGSVLAMDARGDRKLARAAWEKAAAGGVDVANLLPELDVPLAAGPPITLPEMTPQMAALLRPQAWQVYVPSSKGLSRAALGKQGVQNAEGRLEVTVPDDVESPVWLVNAARQPRQFGVRMYVTDLPEGQAFAFLTSAGELKPLAQVALPAGKVKIEFARQGGKFLCRINDQEQEVEVLDEAATSAAGVVGISLPAGGKCVVAGVERR